MNVNLGIHTFTKNRVKIILKLLQLPLPVGQPRRCIIVEQNPPTLKDAKPRQPLRPKINMGMTIIKAREIKK
jgi:hypothetical protein